MQIRTPTMTLGVLLVMAACTPIAAQPSLADVARQEAARRKEVGTSTRVYTNKDVTRGRPLTTAAAVAKSPDPVGTPAAAAPASAPDAAGAAALAPGANAAHAPADPQAAQREEQRARLAEAAALALGQADRLNATIVNLFDETQRRLAIEERDRQLAEYRLRQAEIEQINRQNDEPQRAPTRTPAADPPPPR